MSMNPRFAQHSASTGSTLGKNLARVGVMLLPGALLLVGCFRYEGSPNLMLWLGAAFQVLVCILSFLSRQNYRQPLGPSVVTLYVIALGWLWLGTANLEDWYLYLSQAILLMVPLIFFALYMLADSGASAVRRARLLAQRLSQRKDWPSELSACRVLPEVKAFREALKIDAAPALDLLDHPRPEVRVAALAALEFRKDWKGGQAEMVLRLAQGAPEQAVRAAAIYALGNVDSPSLIESLAEFFRDPNSEVRLAAREALLWDAQRRWRGIRHAIHSSLSDPLCHNDGPYRLEGQGWPEEAVTDWKAWSAEKGSAGHRACLTLAGHYGHLISEDSSPAVVEEVRQLALDAHVPADLRHELVRSLLANHELDREILERLIDPMNPAPVRLIAVEALLRTGEHLEAQAALRDLARLPNREISLATAEVVQRWLGIDMGLAQGEPPPALHTRQAADVTRRVMTWAAGQDSSPDVTPHPHMSRRLQEG
jgi:hypothetical protein